MKRMVSFGRGLDGAFAAVVVASLVLGGGRSALGAEPAPLHLATALYRPTREGDTLAWHARWILAPDAVQRVLGGEPALLRFARPLPEGETLAFAPGVEPVIEDGHLAAVRVTAAGLDLRESMIGHTVRAELVQPLAREARGPFVLGAPIVAGAAVQIVDGTIDASRHVELEPGGALESHVGHVSARAVSSDAREHARRLTGYEHRWSGHAIYVRGDDLDPGGIRARIVDQKDVAHRGSIALAAIFAFVIANLVVVMLRLKRAAGVERADALLAAEIDGADRMGKAR
jgi:hypothetical protein